MLNIEDVEKRLRDNPEPKEVTQIRETILNTFKDLVFVNEGHKYYRDTKEGRIPLVSVSEFTHRFSPEQDWEAIAERYALNHGRTKEDVQKEWFCHNHMATNNGTGVHLYGEGLYYMAMNRIDKILNIFEDDEKKVYNDLHTLAPQYEGGYLFPHSPKEVAALKFWEDILQVNSYYPVLAETRVYTEEYAGTFDLLYYYKHPRNDSKSGLIIFDYKTNASLTNDYAIEHKQMMLEPFDCLVDQAHSHYTLQLSSYQIPLKRLGMNVIGRKIIWLKPDETYEKIDLEDVSPTIERIITHGR